MEPPPVVARRPSFSLLLSLPADPLQNVCAHLLLRDLLRLSLVSKSARRRSDESHYLRTTCDDDDPPPRRAVVARVGATEQLQHRLGHDRREVTAGGPPWAEPSSMVVGHATAGGVASSGGGGGDGSINVGPTQHARHRHGTRTSVSMTNRRLSSLLSRYRSIRVLSLHGLADLGDRFLPIINRAGCAPSLVELVLRDCRLVRDGHNALELQGNDDTLARVTVTGALFVRYKGILGSFVASSGLKCVVLDGCRRLEDGDVDEFLSRRPLLLEELGLPDASRLSAPVLRSSTLCRLDLSRCAQLHSLPKIDCPALTMADFSFAPKLVDAAVTAVVRSCPRLRRLVLRGCASLRDPTVASSSLVELDLGLCSDLRSVAASPCPSLRHIDLAACPALRSVVIDAGEYLSSLDLSMLPLRRLVLVAPSLVELSVAGCFLLGDDGVNADCPSLKQVDLCGSGLSTEPFLVGRGGVMKVREGGLAPLEWHRLGG